RSATRDEELLRLHVLPHVTDVRLDDFALHHAEVVMANLSPKLSAGTRRHVAQVMSRLMNLAVYPGKWVKTTPIPRGWLPRPGDEKAKECLYPDEERALITCVDVSLLRRRAYGPTSSRGSPGQTSTWSTTASISTRTRRTSLARGTCVPTSSRLSRFGASTSAPTRRRLTASSSTTRAWA